MNLFQLVLKQMRQRALSTWLTLLSVMLGVALAIAILVLQRESEAIFGQSDFGFDVLIGPKGSQLQLVLNAVYLVDVTDARVPYSLYEQMTGRGRYARYARFAAPMAAGDNYEGYRIVGTLPKLFNATAEGNPLPPDDQAGRFEYRPGRAYELAEGRIFHERKFEAVIGAQVARMTGLGVGSTFKATHGLSARPDAPKDEHAETWTVVGILQPTGTAADRVLYVPLTSFFAVGGHGEAMVGMAAVRRGADPSTLTAPADHHDGNYRLNADGTIDLHLPPESWQISSILVDTRSPFLQQQLMFAINNRDEAMAVNPASIMRDFFETFLAPSSQALLVISILVCIVAGVSILVSIYNSIAARSREIAIIRALGATRRTILAIVCLEATIVGLLGGALGVVLGHAVAAGGSVYLRQALGEGLRWYRFGPMEAAFVGGVVVLAFLAGLVPALKAYRTPVADNLVAA